jgi:hypothetical protein
MHRVGAQHPLPTRTGFFTLQLANFQRLMASDTL